MTTKLQNSFGAVYRLLEQPRAARCAVVGLLIIHTLLLGYSAYVHSPTLNEPAHLVAGLSHWKFGHFELYRVNPPLVRMVAALPVAAVGYNEDWSGFNEGPGVRPEMSMGENFVAANGERSFFLFMIARWACIPFSWLGAVVCYLWARDLYGFPSGVLAATIWCFEPNILAHASLITPDAGATALGMAACYTFWRWLKHPTWTQAALTGVVLGLAELAKTTLILFYPLWPLLWLIYRWTDRGTMKKHDWLREAGMLTLRMAIGLYILNLGYGFEGSSTLLRDYTFVSDLFTGQESKVEVRRSENLRSEIHSPQLVNRFTNTWLGALPVPLPKNYLLGIDLQQKDFEHYGRPSYLRGEWRDRGWWYYYVYACAIKAPLGLWCLGGLAIMCRLSRMSNHLFETNTAERSTRGISLNILRQPNAGPHDELILLFPSIAIFCVVSAKSGFSEHMRYVLPAFPFFFIALSRIGRIFEKTEAGRLISLQEGLYWRPARSAWRIFCMLLFSRSMVGILTSWIIVSSLWLYPHSLSYFNESVGGPLNGSDHLLGSSVDWGQDLLYVDEFARRSLIPISLAYSGPTNPGLLTGLKSTQPIDADALSLALKSPVINTNLHRRLYLVSVSLARGGPDFARCGLESEYRPSKDLFKKLLKANHFRLLCYSVFISDAPAKSN